MRSFIAAMIAAATLTAAAGVALAAPALADDVPSHCVTASGGGVSVDGNNVVHVGDQTICTPSYHGDPITIGGQSVPDFVNGVVQRGSGAAGEMLGRAEDEAAQLQSQGESAMAQFHQAAEAQAAEAEDELMALIGKARQSVGSAGSGGGSPSPDPNAVLAQLGVSTYPDRDCADPPPPSSGENYLTGYLAGRYIGDYLLGCYVPDYLLKDYVANELVGAWAPLPRPVKRVVQRLVVAVADGIPSHVSVPPLPGVPALPGR